MYVCRYLVHENNDQVKLLLEALQMSVSSCMQHPELATLRPQMIGRLMSANQSPWVAVSAAVLIAESVSNVFYACGVLPCNLPSYVKGCCKCKFVGVYTN